MPDIYPGLDLSRLLSFSLPIDLALFLLDFLMIFSNNFIEEISEYFFTSILTKDLYILFVYCK